MTLHPARRGTRWMLALLALLVIVAASGCSDDSSSTSKQASRGTTTSSEGEAAATATETEPGDESATTEDAPAPPVAARPTAGSAVAPANDENPIVVEAPYPFTNIVRAKGVVLAGSARVSEGTLGWAILGTNLKPLVQGTTQATCGAPCTGRFRVLIPTAKLPLGSFELHAWAPNSADEGPRRLHDTVVPVTIQETVDPNVPAPNSFPPGGAPD